MKTSTMVGLGAIAALGIGAYFLLKDFKMPNLNDLFGAPLVLAGAAPETIKETGAVGGVGDIIYNITGGEGIRERVTGPEGVTYKRAVAEIEREILPAETPVPVSAAQHRAVAMDVSEQIVGEGLPAAMLLGPVTIGAGLGAIEQQRKYREALPTEEAKTKALELEYSTRQKFIQEHPIESMLGFPAMIAHAVTTPTKQTDFFSTMARGWGRIFG